MRKGVWGYKGIEIQGYGDRGVSAALFLYHYPATRFYPFQLPRYLAIPLPLYPFTPHYPFKP